MTHHDVLIVGGGNAGISLAARLLRDGAEDVALVESETVHTLPATAQLRRCRRGDDGFVGAACGHGDPGRVHLDQRRSGGHRCRWTERANPGRWADRLLRVGAVPWPRGGLGRHPRPRGGLRRRLGGVDVRCRDRPARVARAAGPVRRPRGVHRAARAGSLWRDGTQAALHGVRPLAARRRTEGPRRRAGAAQVHARRPAEGRSGAGADARVVRRSRASRCQGHKSFRRTGHSV